MDTPKKCSRCLETKTIDDFYPAKGYADGHYGWCKACHKDYKRGLSSEKKREQAIRVKKWGEANIERRRKHKRDWMNRNRKFRPLSERLHKAISTKVWRQLREGKCGQKTFILIGYTVEELKAHLESRFQAGMSWENYGQWHIDHIKPRSAFVIASYSDPSFRECWALSNLQPLWAKDNLSKWTKH
jgi:hypothetical protein